MLVAEISASIDAAGTASVFYVSEGVFVTSPTDTPVNTAFIPSMMEPGSIGIHTFSDRSTSGSTKLETGEMVLANADGQYDAWIDYSFDGRSIVIRDGEPGTAYPGSWTTVFRGTMESVEADWMKIVIRLKDKQFLFAKPLLTTKYAGNNSLPAGLEGTPSDLKDKVKCRTYGKVYNVSPNFVNTSKLTYQVSDGAVNSIDFVYDRGLALTAGADFATSALLQAGTPAAGGFDTCLAEGYLRLGSSPAGQITADVTQGANAAARTVAQIVKSLALSAGLPSGEISSADVTALDTANSSVVGIYVNEESSFQENIDTLLNSVGGYSSFDGAGVLRMGVLLAPTGTAVKTLYEYDIHEGIERVSTRDYGIPLYRVTINHSKIYVVQPNDLAGATTDVRKAYLAKEYRSVKSEDTAIKTQWLLSGEVIVNTMLTNETDAATEAARQLALYKVRRDLYEVPIQADIFSANSLKLMDVLSIDVDRFSMSGGKLFRLIGFRHELANGVIILQLWG